MTDRIPSSSKFLCPNCRKPIANIKDRPRDLFCFHCHTAVAIVDNSTVFFSQPGEMASGIRASIDVIQVPPDAT